jgi:drug/metabolite transporter (DMT)-like permease
MVPSFCEYREVISMAQGKKIGLGFLLLLTWCVVSAFSRVYTGAAEQHLNPIALCFYITLLAVLVFTIKSINILSSITKKSLVYYKDVLGINIATVGCWFFLFYPLKFLEPSIVGALTLCVTPLATMILGKFIYNQQGNNLYDYLFSILTCVVAGYLVAIGFAGFTAVKHIPVLQNIISILFCIVVSISLACSNIYAKKLSNVGFSPVETLTVRFILLVLFSGVATLFIHGGRTLGAPSATVSAIIIASFSVIIIPQVVYQSAIRELQPISVAMILPLMPVMTFFIEFYDSRLNPTIYAIAGILAILLMTIFSSTTRYYQEKKFEEIKNVHI